MITFDPAVTFGAGAIVGALFMRIIDNILARQRTTEDRNIRYHNEAADGLDAILRKVTKCPSPTNTKIDFSEFRRVLKGTELTRFDRCVEEYETAVKNTPIEHYPEFDNNPLQVIGSGHFNRYDRAPIIAAIDKLREFTKRK